jgi:hypothetical protein
MSCDHEQAAAEVGRIRQHLEQLVALELVEAGGRLVEEEEPRRAGQRAREAEPALVAVRQGLGVAVGEVGEADELEQLRGTRAGGAPPRARPERRGLDVLRHGHAGERAHALERARDADVREALRAPARRVDAVDLDPAGGRPLEPRHRVQERRLARSVRPDDAEDRARDDVEVDPVDGLHADEVDGEARVERRRPAAQWPRARLRGGVPPRGAADRAQHGAGGTFSACMAR